MSHTDAIAPRCTAQEGGASLLIEPRSKDLGGFSVRRVLPAIAQPSVGPFVFFDEMGPAEFPPGQGINVRPHPHIGLATVTYLFDGEILHRDSLGYVQPIQPGAVNLMTAGRGIVHSERTPSERLAKGQRLHGIQVWMALPEDSQETDPAFAHHPAGDLPTVAEDGIITTVIIGAYADITSPVTVLSDTLYLEQRYAAGASLVWQPGGQERAVYVVNGAIKVGGGLVTTGNMAVLESDRDVRVSAAEESQVMVIGGKSITARRMWWNFVHTDPERIEAAKAAWRDGDFAEVPDDNEFIPLPD